MRVGKTVAGIVLGALIAPAAWAVTYDEGVNGELSGDRTMPTVINLTPGTNTITASTASPDLEYFRINLPPATRLTQVVLTSFTSGTNVAFIAVQAGTTFTEPASGPNAANLLGWTHFGNNGTLGTDILDNMGTASPAIGFSGPLSQPAYTFWAQETAASASSYTLTFTVAASPVPAVRPALVVLLGIGLGLLGMWLLRRQQAAAA